MQRIANGYQALNNAQTIEESREGLKAIKLAGVDLEALVRNTLYSYGCPANLIVNLNDKALKLWNGDALSALWVNMNQFYQRFLYSRTQDNKTRELTAFYFLCKDLIECSLEMSAESYYGVNDALRAE